MVAKEERLNQAVALLYEIANSDIAQREEDEGCKSTLLTRVRKFIAQEKLNRGLTELTVQTT